MRLPLLFGLLLAVSAARAQELPGCVAEREGMTACLGEKLCLCRFAPAGS